MNNRLFYQGAPAAQDGTGTLQVSWRFCLATGWHNVDAPGIDPGITVVMAEELRSRQICETPMKNQECARAMQLARFHCAEAAG